MRRSLFGTEFCFMAFTGFNGSAFRAAGDVNRDGFADHIMAGASHRRANTKLELSAYSGNGFADVVVGLPFVAVHANLQNAPDELPPIGDDSGGIFVG